MAETIFTLVSVVLGLAGTLLSIAIVIAIIAMPLLIIFAIYKAIINIMNHNATLKSQENNDTENRWTSGQ